MASFKLGALVERTTSTATSGGTTTLVNNSTTFQRFTGSTTQTVVLPDATTMSVGMKFVIQNRSTGAVTVNANGGGLVATVSAGADRTFQLYANGSSAGTWDASQAASSGGGGGFGSITAIDPSTQSPYTMTMSTDNNKVFFVSSGAGAMQFNLPLPANANGFVFTIKDVGGAADVNNITLNRAGPEALEGVQANYVIAAAYTQQTWACDGINYFIVS